MTKLALKASLMMMMMMKKKKKKKDDDDEASSTGDAQNEEEEEEEDGEDKDDEASSAGDAQDTDDDSEDELAGLMLAASLQPKSDTAASEPFVKQETPDATSSTGIKQSATPDRKGKGRADETPADTSVTLISTSSPRTSRAAKGTNSTSESITETNPKGGRGLSVEVTENKQVDEGPAPINPADIKTDAASQPSSETLVCTWAQQCELHLFDAAHFGFYPQRKNVEASLWIPGPDTEDQEICWLTVTGPDERTGEQITLISTQLGKEQSLTFQGVGDFGTFNKILHLLTVI
ncbi:hypothetical protein DFH28DRAFT_431084 [Melampsora americana]|nr:hypothetical protein DFH28DRAFT_431084 [Melampsora americana]